MGCNEGMVQLVSGPVSHALNALMLYDGLLYFRRTVILTRFAPELVETAVDQCGAEILSLAPSMMRWLIPTLERRDKRKLGKRLFHTGSPCPPHVKEAWIDHLGPESVLEMYGMSEALGSAIITGSEWLQHRGSVGRPHQSLVEIRDVDGRQLKPREVGTIWMAIQAPNGSAHGDFRTVGDLGWLDEEGYLYITDRRDDLILVGGRNVSPAEVEAVLQTHPAVRDVAVVAQADSVLGSLVHAFVELVEGSRLDRKGLRGFCRDMLPSYAVPARFTEVESLPRNEAGKVLRRSLRERVGG
jgi:bile acid-coenzyme A ligase